MALVTLPEVNETGGDALLDAASDALKKATELSTEELGGVVLPYFMTSSFYLGRTAVKMVWITGGLFKELKQRMDHGEWLPYLDSANFPQPTVARWMRVYDHMTEEQIGEFDTVRDALKAIKRAKQGSEEEEPVPSISTSLGLSKEDKLRQDIQALETGVKVAHEEKQELEVQVKELEEQNKHLLTGERVAEGYEAGLSVLEERQNEIRQLNDKIKDLRSRLNEEKKTFASYKRWVGNEFKKKDEEIDRLKLRIRELANEEGKEKEDIF